MNLVTVDLCLAHPGGMSYDESDLRVLFGYIVLERAVRHYTRCVIVLPAIAMDYNRFQLVVQQVRDIALEDERGFKLSTATGNTETAAHLLIAYLKSKFSNESYKLWDERTREQLEYCDIQWERKPRELLAGSDRWKV